MNKNILLFLLCFMGISELHLFAQESKDIKTSTEDVFARCEEKPMDERVRAVVARFSLAVPNRSYELGENMSSMLTNALFQINCFQMLTMRKDQADLESEIYGDENFNNSTLVEQGEMLGAQIIVSGEITEFSIQNKSGGIGAFRTNREIVKLGFILRMVDPATRRILWQESINVEGKANGSTSVGLRFGRLGRINFGEKTNDNPAVANALEQGVLRASELLVENIDGIEMPKGADPSLKNTIIVVKKVDYMQNQNLSSLVGKLEGVGEVKVTFSNAEGQLKVRHKGETQDFMNVLYNQIKNSYQILEVVPGQIVLAKN
ncbi:MAG: CsgG/HfaB family protein [Bacteroidota bacterium]